MRRTKQSHNGPFITPTIIDLVALVSMVICSLLSIWAGSIFLILRTHFHFPMHDCWLGRGDFTHAGLLVSVRIVPRVHQKRIDSGTPPTPHPAHTQEDRVRCVLFYGHIVLIFSSVLTLLTKESAEGGGQKKPPPPDRMVSTFKKNNERRGVVFQLEFSAWCLDESFLQSRLWMFVMSFCS